ncbi:unnamed protein product [Symbiodinium necroappetens]|uniref:Uncharacterized protein n=1 Tax=Symbiodinium necroappetens TaxID=1628268 RepID=A0A812XZV2_9DINO|nr:unnamed protein product [Symbiodinium necroappetens]
MARAVAEPPAPAEPKQEAVPPKAMEEAVPPKAKVEAVPPKAQEAVPKPKVEWPKNELLAAKEEAEWYKQASGVGSSRDVKTEQETTEEDQVYWQKDEHDPDLWWKWSQKRGWQRWKGWLTKMGVVLHKRSLGEKVDHILDRFAEHPSMVPFLRKLDRDYATEGERCYRHWL